MPFLVPEQVPEKGCGMAAKRRHWKEKDGRFWARIAIPAKLQPYFDPKFDSKPGKFAIFNFLIPYFSMSYCPRASCVGEALL